jgi:hypothetical protein
MVPLPPPMPLSVLALSRARKSGDMHTFFPKATPEARVAMGRRMMKDWKVRMAERREEDEAEQARRKWQKTEGDRKRKCNQRAWEVAAGIGR